MAQVHSTNNTPSRFAELFTSARYGAMNSPYIWPTAMMMMMMMVENLRHSVAVTCTAGNNMAVLLQRRKITR